MLTNASVGSEGKVMERELGGQWRMLEMPAADGLGLTDGLGEAVPPSCWSLPVLAS